MYYAADGTEKETDLTRSCRKSVAEPRTKHDPPETQTKNSV